MFHLTDVLRYADLNPEDVAVIFHTPREQETRRLFAWWAAERPSLFETYQSNHSRNAEATLKARRFMASMVNLGDRSFLFLGLYENAGGTWMSYADMDRDPRFLELFDRSDLQSFASKGFDSDDGRFIFDFKLTEMLRPLIGRLQVTAPSAPRPYVRKAENLDVETLSISKEPMFGGTLPDWRIMTLTRTEIMSLPLSWSEALRHWRGVYLIVDEADGARYVGSAYGRDNLLGRWTAHVTGVMGVTRDLSKRRTENFRFSILERLDPDMEAAEVIARENTWKVRLHTVRFGLNAA